MSQKIITSLLSALLVATTLFTVPANAAGNQTTITFKASIVIPPCHYDVQNKNIDLRCYNVQENKMKTTNIDFNKHAKSIDWKELENNRGIYQLKWTNKEKGFAMFSVQHA